MTKNQPMNITLAPQDSIETFEDQVDLLLAAMGFAQALVTDESQVGDFISHYKNIEDNPKAVARNQKILDGLSKLMEREVGEGEYLWRLAHEIYVKTKLRGAGD